MTDKKQKWDVEAFIKILNVEAPLKNREGEDSRRTNEWNVRLLRHYATEKAISKPLKEGRKAYYTEEHLKEIQMLLQSQSLGISSKFYSSNSEKLKSSVGSYLRSTSSLCGSADVNTNSLFAQNNSASLFLTEDADLQMKRKSILSILEDMDKPINNKVIDKKEDSKQEIDYMWKHVKINDYLTIMVREDNLDKKDEIIKLLKNLR